MALKHSIPHDLGLELGRKVTARALESYRDDFAEYSPQGRWVSADRAEVSFSVAGKTLAGAVDVKARVIELELKVPFLFRPFKSIAIGVIENEIREWINRAKAGELDEP
ncbi:MAG: polyhydroxyalkanoic acid system family protein [Proteobacteria bacterium]|nr:polyhydroxyalkanoic acid system family protein [Pseudomonadota bacterium]